MFYYSLCVDRLLAFDGGADSGVDPDSGNGMDL